MLEMIKCLYKIHRNKKNSNHFYLSDFLNVNIRSIELEDVFGWLNSNTFKNKAIHNKRKLEFWSIFFKEANFKDMYPNFIVFTYKIHNGFMQTTVYFDHLKRTNKVIIMLEKFERDIVMFEFNLLRKQLQFDSKIKLDLPHYIRHRIDQYNPKTIQMMF